jgi:hypothetical protein
MPFDLQHANLISRKLRDDSSLYINFVIVPGPDEPRLHPSEVHYIIVHTDLPSNRGFLDCVVYRTYVLIILSKSKTVYNFNFSLF